MLLENRIICPEGRETLIATNLGKVFKSKEPAVRDVSFTLDNNANKILGVVGPTGAGKSTLFKLLTMMEKRSQGSVELLGKRDFSWSGQQVGMLAQEDILWPELTVSENIEFIGRLKGLSRETIRSHQDTLQEVLSLQQFAKTYAADLSGGNKRKLACAMALIGKPQVVILDEPATGLDPVSRKNLYRYLK